MCYLERTVRESPQILTRCVPLVAFICNIEAVNEEVMVSVYLQDEGNYCLRGISKL